MNKPASEDFICWLCDNGLLVGVVILVIGGALIFRGKIYGESESILSFYDTPTPITTITPTVTLTPEKTYTLTPTITPEPTSTIAHSPTPTNPPPPEFIFVMMPVHWKGGLENFEEAADEQIEFYIEQSGMNEYFDIKIEYIMDSMDHEPLTSENLVFEIVNEGVMKVAGDRYIGITNGDIARNGDSMIAGWTMFGSPGVVCESEYLNVTAHELGHTFGLCDEYQYDIWLEQDQWTEEGCPNPFPSDCTQTGICSDVRNPNGLYSIMGIARDNNDLSFNNACMNALNQRFLEMIEE